MAIGVLQSGAILLCVLLVGPVTGCDVNPPCYDGEMLVNGCCVSCDKPSPSVCPKGAGIQNSTCGAGCEPCPAGQFNDGTMKQCQLCKNCATQHRDLVQPGCRKDANTICGNCFKGYYVPDEYKTEFDNPGTQICQRCPSNSRHKDCYVSATTNKVTTPATTAPETIQTTTPSPTTAKSSTTGTTTTNTKSSTRKTDTLGKYEKQNVDVKYSVKNGDTGGVTATHLVVGVVSGLFGGGIIVSLVGTIVYKKKLWRICNTGTISTSTSTRSLNASTGTSASGSAFSSENSLDSKGNDMENHCHEPLLGKNSLDAAVTIVDETLEFNLQTKGEGEHKQESTPLCEEELNQRTVPYDMTTSSTSIGSRLAQHNGISQSSVPPSEEHILTADDVFAPSDVTPTTSRLHAQETGRRHQRKRRVVKRRGSSSSSTKIDEDKTGIYNPESDSSGYEDNPSMPINSMQKSGISASLHDLCSNVRTKLAKDMVVENIPLDIKDELAKDLDPEDSGVKGWKHFGEKLRIAERELKNLSHVEHRTKGVLNIACTRRVKVVDILDALKAIERYDALHRLCKALVKHTKQQECIS